MFMMIGTTKCPMCHQKKESLSFWRNVYIGSNKEYFHICNYCKKKKNKTSRELLNIGFITGYQKCLENIKEKIRDLQDE